MDITDSETFVCPTCGAIYKVVRLNVGPTSEPISPPVECLCCKQTMPGTDGTDFLKYFLWRTSRKN